MRVQTKVITINFDPQFLAEVDEAARQGNFATRNQYIKAVLRKEIDSSKALPTTSSEVQYEDDIPNGEIGHGERDNGAEVRQYTD